MSSHKTVTDQIKHYQRDIDKRPENSERVLRCIQRLFVLPVNVQHLEETGIGKSVNALRKYGGEVEIAAKSLVFKWKAMVATAVDAERASESEQESGNSTPVKDNLKPSSSEKDSRRNEKSSSYYCNGKEKRSRDNDSKYCNSPEKRLKTSNSHPSSKDIKLKENKHYNNHKSVTDGKANDKDRKSNTKSVDRDGLDNKNHRTDRYKEDRTVREKENRNHRHHSSNKSSTSNKDPPREKRRIVQSDNDEEEKNSKKRRYRSPTPSEDEASDNVSDHSRGRSEGSDEEKSEDEDVERSNEDEDEEDEEDDSEDELPRNPYLDTFIKTEPETSEEESDLVQDVDIDGVDSEEDIGSEKSVVESNEGSINGDVESEREVFDSEHEEEDVEDCEEATQDDSQHSRLSPDSDESDYDTRRQKYKSSPEKGVSGNVSDSSHKSKKSSHREIDKNHEKHRQSLSSSSRNKHSHSVKSSSSGGSKSSSSNSYNSTSGSNSRHSSSGSSNIKISNNSDHNKHREKVKEKSKEKSSRSISDKDVKQNSESKKLKDEKRRASVDKHRSSSSSSKLSSSKSSSSTSSSSSSKATSSSSDRNHKPDSRSSSSHHSKSHSHSAVSSSKSSGSSSSSSKSSTNESSKSNLIKEIKQEPMSPPSSNTKENLPNLKNVKTDNNSKSADVKVKQDTKKIKTEKLSEIENGIDSGSGASFADALLGMTETIKKVSKKKVPATSAQKKTSSQSTVSAPVNKHSHQSVDSGQSSSLKSHSTTSFKEPTLLKKSIKLEPLEKVIVTSTLPEISPNYHPLPHYPPSDLNSGKKTKSMTEDEALASIMSTKNHRTKVFSGNKIVGSGTVPTLFKLCIQIIQENVDGLEYTGGVPYDILKPVLDRMTADQLFQFEHYNPYLIEDTDVHWEFHCNKEFRGKKRDEMETWRDLYMRCLDEREMKFKNLTASINQSIAQSTPVRKTKLAYINNVVKPPRNVAKTQAKFGTASSVKHDIISKAVVGGNSGSPTKTVVPPPQPSSSRFNQSSSAVFKKKKAPLMQKTLQLMKGNRFKR